MREMWPQAMRIAMRLKVEMVTQSRWPVKKITLVSEWKMDKRRDRMSDGKMTCRRLVRR